MERMKVALVAIAKNEDDYLKEWVDYNLDIGFSEIFVYQNNWRYRGDGIDDRRVHLLEMDGHRMQVPCYNTFIRGHFPDFDFAAFFDVDEFLYIKNGQDVCSAMEAYRGVDSVFVNWRLFGDSGLSAVHDGNYSVLERFTWCDSGLYRLGKHILNLDRTQDGVIFNNPHILQAAHGPLREVRGKDPALKRECVLGSLDGNTEDEPMELYHFRNKTWEEAVKRRYMQDDAFHEASRTDFHVDIRAVRREFDNHNRNIVENRNIWRGRK